MNDEIGQLFARAPDELRHEVLSIVWLEVHQQARARTQLPCDLPSDPAFALRVVSRLFADRPVADAWNAARGPAWLAPGGEPVPPIHPPANAPRPPHSPRFPCDLRDRCLPATSPLPAPVRGRGPSLSGAPLDTAESSAILANFSPHQHAVLALALAETRRTLGEHPPARFDLGLHLRLVAAPFVRQGTGDAVVEASLASDTRSPSRDPAVDREGPMPTG